MACAGIDFGSRNCVVALARRGGVDICSNEVSNRATPAMVSFSGGERHIGESALTFAPQNYKNTIDNIIRLLGAHFGSDYTKKELEDAAFSGVPAKPDKDGNVAVGVEVMYNGEKKVVRMEAVAAMMLTKLIEIASNEFGSKVNDVVISVPGYFTNVQRQALVDACRIAGVKPLRLMNEHAAVALAYGIFRTSELPEKDPVKVAFVDAGDASTCVTIASFTKSKAQIKAVAFEHSFGGRDLDDELMKHFNEEFKTKYGIDAFSKPRPKMRLRKECQKLKKILSANPEGVLNIECLMDDKDVSSHMKREDFEKLIQPHLDKLTACAERAVAAAGIKEGEKLHAVELVGGCTRVPLVKDTVSKVFSKFGAPLKTTLNLDEAVARGCAMMSAMLSPLFRVKDYDVVDITNNSVIINKTWAQNQEKIRLIKEFHVIPTLKALTFTAQGDVQLQAEYKEDNHEGKFGKEISIAQIHPPKDDQANVRVKIRLNANGLLEWHSAQVLKEVQETTVVQVPAKEEKSEDKTAKEGTAPATGEKAGEAKEGAANEHKEDVEMKDAEAEGKKDEASSEAKKKSDEKSAAPAAPKTIPEKRTVTKMQTTDLKIKEIRNTISLSGDELKQCQADEQQMRDADRAVKERADALNALESYVYDIRARIGDEGGDLAPFGPAKVREELRKELDDNENWIYSEEGDEAEKKEFLDRRAKLEEKASKMLFRKKDDDERPSYVKSLEKSFDEYKKLASPDPKYEHISEVKKKETMKKVEETALWLKDMKSKQEGAPKDSDPVLSCAMLQEKQQELDSVCRPILNTPKPKPKPKEEPKKEEPKKDSGEKAKDDQGKAEPSPTKENGTTNDATAAAAAAETEAKVKESGPNDAMEVDKGEEVPVNVKS